MTIETLNQRIASMETKLDKLNKKYARILKAEESDYNENNPYYYTAYDKKYCEKEIAETEANLEKYKQQLSQEQEKAASRDVQVIIEFLDRWKQKIYARYEADFDVFFEKKAEFTKIAKIIKETYDYTTRHLLEAVELEKQSKKIADELYNMVYGYYEEVSYISDWGYERTKKVKVSAGEYEHLAPYIETHRSQEECLALVKKDLEKEANRKYDFIIERTNKIVGQITDASNLYIGEKDDLNGFIIGTKGKAKVQTIGAGGYNEDIIVNEKHGQRFHFRTLIKEVK